ncbi:hypothetical protein EDD85DRAFT_798383 [Armillaria nabsnona]|nr:hypothetical protein EDD85DRAFT_798383 [Armillaria nabsnona]
MADAMGVASSVSASMKNILTLINYVKDVYNAPTEISQFLKELKFLRIYLSAVDVQIWRSTENGPWLKILKQLDDNPPDSVFKELMELLEKHDKKLRIAPPQWKMVKKRLLWTLTKTSVEEDLKRIERLKTLVMSAVQVDHMLTSVYNTLSHAMVADVKATVDVILIDNKAEKVASSLLATSVPHVDSFMRQILQRYMHDEDKTIGILVKDPHGCPWTLYSNKRALDRVNDDSGTRCVDSVQASANEIYKAYQTQIGRLWNFKTNWWFWSTALKCKTGGWWDYPIMINGLRNIIPWSTVAATTLGVWHLHVLPAAWQWYTSEPTKDPIFNAVLFTPLAAINFNGGKEISVLVYYLDEQYVLQEYCYSAHKGRWFSDELGDMKIQAATDTSIAAIQYGDECGSVHIQGICNDGYWFRGATFPVALSGSSIAAVVYSWNGLQLRVYYQTDDLSIKEHCLNDYSGWVPGELDIGKAPGCVPISALGYVSSTEGPELHIVGTKNTDSWGPVNKVVGGLKPSTQFAATQLSNGKYLRLYYQAPYDSVLEMVNDGASWEDGATVGEVY